jgi:hypothetical protein
VNFPQDLLTITDCDADLKEKERYCESSRDNEEAFIKEESVQDVARLSRKRREGLRVRALRSMVKHERGR